MPKTPFDKEWVSASEIGSHLYCARAAWLSHQKIPVSEKASHRMKKGSEAHAGHGRTLKYQKITHGLALKLMIAGAAILVLGYLFSLLRS